MTSTDEHISPVVAGSLRKLGIDAVALQDRTGSIGLGAGDHDLLAAAINDARLLVSYDRSTIEPLLKNWAETGLHHAGVVLVDDKTIRSSDIGGLVRALTALVVREAEVDWRDRVVYLRRT